MNASDIVGWTTPAGAAYCEDHKPDGDEDEVHAVFASEEGWESMTCDHPHNAEGEPLLFESLGQVAGVESEDSDEESDEDQDGEDDQGLELGE